MRIFHIATAADWAAAQTSGAYTTSTHGRTLEQEGFLHASRREQVAGVFAAFYRQVSEPLVLLAIDTDRLDVPWREDPVGEDTFPHIYGPLRPRAVVDVQPLNRKGGTESFSVLFFKEMMLRAGLGIAVMVLAVVFSAIGARIDADDGALVGAGLGLLVGLAAMVLLLRRRG